MTEAKTQITSALLLSLSLCCSALGQDFFPTPIERGPLAVAIKEFAVLPDSGSGSSAPARMSVMTVDPLGRLLVNDQRGPLYIVSTDGEAVTEYLDLRDFPTLQVNSIGGERGFQSFTFHPDFNAQDTAGFGKFYTIHSSNNTTPTPDFDPGGGTSFHTLLLEWTTDVPASSTFVPANAAQTFRAVLRFDQPFGNHNAGLIAFNTSVGSADPDRTNLYIAMGDGGSGGDPQENGQDAGNPYGAILRIDPTGTDSGNGQYGIVSDNALAADGDGGTLAEIYSYGLRNPQRFGWDIATGAMYIADIGQNAVEEIDLGVNGGNFGWDQREGSFEFEGAKTADMIDPLAEYDHTNVVSDPPTSIGNRAVTTGEVACGTGNYRDGKISRAALVRRMAPVRREVERLLLHGVQSGNASLVGMCRELYDHRDWLWTFVRCEGVEPTNNVGERVLRHAVIWRKLSFGTQSGDGSRFVETMLTVIETCRQQRRNAFEYLTAAIHSHVARKPAPSLRPRV
jgi:hypothetical protein